MISKELILGILMVLLFSCSDSTNSHEHDSKILIQCNVESTNKYVFDASRNRQIPLQIYSLSDSTHWNKELVILNAGYGSSNTEYDYIAQALAKEGYYVISIQHELQNDEMLPSGDDVIQLRMPNWKEGVKSIKEILNYLNKTIPVISTEKIHLIGHSNGGDISVLFSSQNPKRTASLITLDHRRMPIPLSTDFKILSIRADQFEADPNVIPSIQDQQKYGIEIIYLKNVDHNYLRDIATMETKETVVTSIIERLKN